MFTIDTIENAFADQQPAVQKSNIAIANYIRTVAGAMGVDIKGWDILATFGTGTDNNLTTDKRKINKILFEKSSGLSADGEPVKRERAKLTELQAQQLREA